MYDRHDDFNDFILSDNARQSLLRHISVATSALPANPADEHGTLPAEHLPKSSQREDDHSLSIDASVNLGRKHPGDRRQAPNDNRHRPRNTQMAYLGNDFESLTADADAPSDFVTARQEYGESMVMGSSTSRPELHTSQVGSSKYLHDGRSVRQGGEKLFKRPSSRKMQY